MTSILPKFLRGAPTFPEGGFVGEGLKLDEKEIPFVASQGETEVYRRQPRDARLRLELRDRLKELHAEEVSLVMLQATRKAIRAIDAAGSVIVADEKPYTPVQSAVQNRMPASENTRKLEHTAIVDGKAVTEEIEIDEADLEREIGDYAKAC